MRVENRESLNIINQYYFVLPPGFEPGTTFTTFEDADFASLSMGANNEEASLPLDDRPILGR